MQKIILKQSEREILSQYSENQKPNESCAILFGKNNEVLDIFLTENIDENKNTSTSVGKISNSHKEIINIINKRIFNE